MPLPRGKRLGPYEILDLLGSGGMGEVYQARDTRLERLVAIKILTAGALAPPSALARFEREARAISRLSHPHICALYDVGYEEGIYYLVMEHLQGETLSHRVSRGALSLDETLQHAIQIVDALDNAHSSGIVHSDLKPANVMLTQAGVKLLDFGIAKLRDPEVEPTGDLSAEADTLTAEGAPLGTLPYMSPEQVEGRPIDARSDIFSFGAVLYRMLTLRRAFDGESRAALTAAILSSEPPPPSSLQRSCPRELDRLVARCLAKDRDRRWQTARDLLQELRWIASSRSATAHRWRRSRALWGATAGLIVVVGLLIAVLIGSRGDEPLPAGSPRRVTTAPGWEASPALSPDGGLIAYASDESGDADIWMVDVHGGNALRLTDDPAPDRDPAWFPDASAVAFTSERGGRVAIWKVPRLGGAASLLVPDAEDAAIAPDGTRIAFTRPGAASERRIWVAPIDEPERAKMITKDGDGWFNHRRPAWSPDGKWICYGAERDLWLVSAAGEHPRRLTSDDEADMDPAWSRDGRHIYFSSLRGGALALWRISPSGGRPQRLTLGTGPEGHPSLSRDGRRLAYSTFMVHPELTLLELSTRKETRVGVFDPADPAWSPDGSHLVFASPRIGGRYDLWVQSLAEGRPAGFPRRLTDHPGSVAHPAYSPDGRWVAYYRVVAGQRDVWTIPASGGEPVRFTDSPAADVHPAWSPDGKQLAFASERDGRLRIWAAPVEEGRPAGPARRLTSGPTRTDMLPAWSPDGRWIAYVGDAADESSDSDVWITDASGAGKPPRALATEGRAQYVVWAPDSRALFVSGQWGSGVSLRKYSLDTGRRIPLDPSIQFGQDGAISSFDVSRIGHVVAFAKHELRGDIWALESLDRPY